VKFALSSSIAAFTLVAALVAACHGGTPAVVAPADATPTRGAAASSCASCHAAIADEWRSSFHRTSFTDADFQASLAMERREDHPFCVQCHAPVTARGVANGGSDGVDCTSCHTSAHASPRVPMRTSAEEAGTRTCATCHEFTFGDGREELVQKTLSEHEASSFSGVSCADCHMPSRDGHKDHRFVAGHAPQTLGRAVHVDATRRDARTVRVSVQVDAGHAFPTGDMFRRARLLVFVENADAQIVGDAERTFGRTWGGVRNGEHAGARTQTSDTRIRGRWEQDIVFDDVHFPIAHVRWSLVYERLLAMRGEHVSILSSDVIAEGKLAW
jgi:hypothetical protein